MDFEKFRENLINVLIVLVTGVLFFYVGSSYEASRHESQEHSVVFHNNDDAQNFEDEHKTEGKDDSMVHDKVEVDSELVPKVEVELTEDLKSGYNLKIITENFTFTPDKASMDDQTQNEGHAHLFINGEKIARIYSTHFHIDDSLLVEGGNEVKVTLNANDHSQWAVDGEVLEGTIDI